MFDPIIVFSSRVIMIKRGELSESFLLGWSTELDWMCVSQLLFLRMDSPLPHPMRLLGPYLHKLQKCLLPNFFRLALAPTSMAWICTRTIMWKHKLLWLLMRQWKKTDNLSCKALNIEVQVTQSRMLSARWHIELEGLRSHRHTLFRKLRLVRIMCFF